MSTSDNTGSMAANSAPHTSIESVQPGVTGNTQATDLQYKKRPNEASEQGYPIEQPFKLPLLISTALVLFPSLLIYWFFGESDRLPRLVNMLFGNWISPIILWFFVASLIHLLLKHSLLKKERQQTRRLGRQILPAVVTRMDAPETNGTLRADSQLYARIEDQAVAQGTAPQNLLLYRLSLFLHHHENDVDETFGIKEREFMRGSFSLPRFMVWAIPIIGFIGTVWGISNGIAHFSDAMSSTNSVSDVSAMLKENLPLVTRSLATAFDTTLLALLLSIPLMMVMIWLEKSEEAYLIDLEESWFHDIKPLLSRGFGSAGVPYPSGEPGNAPVSADGHAVATEIKLLSTQIKALQETMEDLYETVFTSRLDKK